MLRTISIAHNIASASLHEITVVRCRLHLSCKLFFKDKKTSQRREKTEKKESNLFILYYALHGLLVCNKSPPPNPHLHAFPDFIREGGCLDKKIGFSSRNLGVTIHKFSGINESY